MKTAQQAVANWLKAMSSPTTQQAYKDGINATTVNPMAAAATPQAMDAYLNGVQNSVTSGRRAAALQAADPNVWKQNAVTVGATRLQSGAQKSQNKYANKIAKYAAVWPQMRAASAALPSGGLANAQAKQNAALAVLMQAAGTA